MDGTRIVLGDYYTLGNFRQIFYLPAHTQCPTLSTIIQNDVGGWKPCLAFINEGYTAAQHLFTQIIAVAETDSISADLSFQPHSVDTAHRACM